MDNEKLLFVEWCKGPLFFAQQNQAAAGQSLDLHGIPQHESSYSIKTAKKNSYLPWSIGNAELCYTDIDIIIHKRLGMGWQ